MLSRLFFAAAAVTLVGCYQAHAWDEFDRYLQRKDTVTLSAGDAKEVNARAHMLTPWPPGVYDRRIFADGSRMARAVQCYEAGPQGPGQGQGQGQWPGQGGGGLITLNLATGQGASAGAGQQGQGCY